ncbi:ribonuclease Y [bacterium]|nr:MAG: ribonuclease Y [bacterium]
MITPDAGMIVGVGVGFAVAVVLTVAWLRHRDQRQLESARSAAASIIAEAETAGREVVLAARDDAIRIRDEAEQEAKRKRRDLDRHQDKLTQRRERLDQMMDQAERRTRALDRREREVEARGAGIAALEAEQHAALERIAGMTRADAHAELLQRAAEEARADTARVIREIEQSAREAGDARAREIVVTCIQRCATDVVSDIVSSTITLPTDEMKGRIIGRQGRNIRAFEQATGVDVIVDDTPEAITLSCFDPVRREVGRLAILALVADGRIHPARIEQVVRKSRDEVERTIVSAGEEAAFEAGVPGLHPEILKLLGRLRYRTSYGQNVLRHSIETAHLAAMLANETGADVAVARAGGLLHDIGKAVSHEVDGPHAIIGAELAARYGVPPLVVNAVAAHHHEVESETLEAILVETADAISGSRPGARRESLELYIKRIAALESIASGFKGVEESYAIQAGREIRIIVRPEEVDDLEAIQLSRQIARKVEETMEYPGQVKVTVIREMRAVDFAR